MRNILEDAISKRRPEVSNAFEERLRKPLFGQADGEPLLGMEKFVTRLKADERPGDWVRSPNIEPVGGRDASRATAHGSFDDDGATLKATLARVLDKETAKRSFSHHRSASSNRDVREALMATAK